MKYRAVLFDLDGVLVDATDWHYEALNKALRIFGYTISREQHLGEYNGLPTRVKLARLTENENLPESLHGFIFKMKQKYTEDFIRRFCRPDYAKLLLLKRVKSRNMKIAVCTNAIREMSKLMLKMAMVEEYVDLLVSNQDVKSPKPDPEMYVKAMESFGLEADRCLIVEDNDYGIRAGRAAGGHVVVVSGYPDVNWSLIEPHLTGEGNHA